MKHLLIIAITSIFLSCNSEDTAPAQSTQNSAAPTTRRPELSTGNKTDFKKIEKLPAGIDSIFNKMPSKENGYYKFSFPRTDLNVSLDGIKIDPRLAFTTWFAFRPMDTVNAMAMVMGDVVLLETEFKAVLQKMDQRGLDVSAIHNHLLNEKPKVMYLHVSAMGEPKDLCVKLKELLQLTHTPLNYVNTDTASTMEWGMTEKNMGVLGKKEGSVYKFSIPRNERIKEEGMELPETFGVNSVVNFQKAGNKAAVTGDFILLGTEISTAQRILSRAGILVTAIHSHMLFDEPHFYFMHFWAVDDAEKIANALHDLLVHSNHKL